MISVDMDTSTCLRLWAAVLVQAAEDAWSGNELDSRTARRWLVSEDQRIGGFVWVCGLFDLDPERTAAEILRSKITMQLLRNRVFLQGQRRLAQQRGWYRDDVEPVSMAVGV